LRQELGKKNLPYSPTPEKTFSANPNYLGEKKKILNNKKENNDRYSYLK